MSPCLLLSWVNTQGENIIRTQIDWSPDMPLVPESDHRKGFLLCTRLESRRGVPYTLTLS